MHDKSLKTPDDADAEEDEDMYDEEDDDDTVGSFTDSSGCNNGFRF